MNTQLKNLNVILTTAALAAAGVIMTGCEVTAESSGGRYDRQYAQQYPAPGYEPAPGYAPQAGYAAQNNDANAPAATLPPPDLDTQVALLEQDPQYGAVQPAPDAYTSGQASTGVYQPDAPPPVVDVNAFAVQLQPMGEWVDVPGYHECWRPRGVPQGWRPYTVGHWVYTDVGCTWQSEEPWGDITCHYGGWVEDPRAGWVWVPGRVWAPAWVAWRSGGDNVGWAPLPPQYCTDRRRIQAAEIERIPPQRFCFVPQAQILQPHVEQHVRPPAQNVTIIKNTVNITNITVVNRKVVNNSFTAARAEAATHQRVQTVQLQKAANAAEAAKLRAAGKPVVFAPPPDPKALAELQKRQTRDLQTLQKQLEAQDKARIAQQQAIAKQQADYAAAVQRQNTQNVKNAQAQQAAKAATAAQAAKNAEAARQAQAAQAAKNAEAYKAAQAGQAAQAAKQAQAAQAAKNAEALKAEQAAEAARQSRAAQAAKNAEALKAEQGTEAARQAQAAQAARNAEAIKAAQETERAKAAQAAEAAKIEAAKKAAAATQPVRR